jgi:hypothetical protein
MYSVVVLVLPLFIVGICHIWLTHVENRSAKCGGVLSYQWLVN